LPMPPVVMLLSCVSLCVCLSMPPVVMLLVYVVWQCLIVYVVWQCLIAYVVWQCLIAYVVSIVWAIVWPIVLLPSSSQVLECYFCVLQCVAVGRSGLEWVAMGCSGLQRVVVRFSELQCVAVRVELLVGGVGISPVVRMRVRVCHMYACVVLNMSHVTCMHVSC